MTFKVNDFGVFFFLISISIMILIICELLRDQGNDLRAI